MSRRPACPGQRGFALVEALVSLVIVAMICMMILAGMSVGRRTWERIDAREAAGETIDAAQQSLRDRLEQAYPTTLYDVQPLEVAFHGASDRLQFVSSPPAVRRPSPLRRYGLSVDTAGELVLASASDVDPRVVSEQMRQVLLTGVRAIDIAYFGRAGPDYAEKWRADWDQQPAPPELVRVRVAFGPQDSRVWPDLIVRPRTTVDANCLVDLTTQRCRGRP
jgi:general secretion pathway protein J